MVLLPTLNRTEKLKTFLKSVTDTKNELPGRVLVDKDDWIANQPAYISINNEFMPKDWAFEITEAVTMGGKCREFIPKLKPETRWIMLTNDDHLCVSNKCLELLVSKLDGKNFVSSNDGTVNSFRLPATATAWSVPLLQCLGWPIYPNFLEHLFIDNLWLELGKATGCWRLVAAARVDHHHVLFGKAQEDDTHRKVYNQERWAQDEAGYKKFMATEFPEAVRRIKQFQNYLPGEQWNPKVTANVQPSQIQT